MLANIHIVYFTQEPSWPWSYGS